MNSLSRRDHWDKVYLEKAEDQVSWFEEAPTVSLELIRNVRTESASGIIDVGGGASRLVDALLNDGFQDVTILDVSEAALATAQSRLGEKGAKVMWVVGDVTQWEPVRRYDVWHDRAVFHFLTEAADRAAYVERLLRAVPPGGHAIIGTFALDGPERCSGLPVVRHDAASLAQALGNAFALVETRRHDHRTPMGGTQHFQFSVFRRT